MSIDSVMTLQELCSAVLLALATDYAGSGSERTRDVPDARTIRYYTTLGLLDRPESYRGRTALYARRHLVQLVAIKRLQAKGNTLSQIQTQLLGISPAQLEKLANIPKTAGVPDEIAPGKTRASRSTRSFWKEPPVPVASEDSPGVPPVSLLGIPLNSEVTLLLPALRQLDAMDLEGVQTAAQPLLRWLRLRRILPDSPN